MSALELLSVVRELRSDMEGMLERLERIESKLSVAVELKLPATKVQKTPPEHPFYGLTPSAGLHVLKDKWCQKSFIGQQSEYLCRELDLAINATRSAAPRRTADQSYRLGESEGRIASEELRHGERQLEHGIWKRWTPLLNPKLQECAAWEFIAQYQVPLFDAQERRGWGHVDLIGINGDRLVIVELKRGDSRESPTRPLMEAAAYAIALQENWDVFFPELEALIQSFGKCLPEGFNSEKIVLAIVAPSQYWNAWKNDKAVPSSAWEQFSQLVDEMSKRGLESRFADLKEDLTVEDAGFPTMQR